MATTLYVPSAIEYQGKLVPVLAAQKEIGLKAPAQAALLRSVSGPRRGRAQERRDPGEQPAGEKPRRSEDVEKRAFAFCNEVKPLFEKIRSDVDALELMLPSDMWPVPKYREMLFLM